MNKIRVLVVDDSAFMRKMIGDILSSDPDIEVVDRARNGLDGVEKVKQLKPDVITLDIEMPIMNGLEALEKLMQQHPLPVVMLSSLTKEGADATIRALELGAFDFVTKPSGPISLDIHTVANSLIEVVKAAAQGKGKPKRTTFASRFSIQTAQQATSHPVAPVAPKVRPQQHSGVKVNKLVAVGTSTGGPKALQTLLTALPSTLSTPMVIVQHMPPGFTKSLAQRLDSLCAIRVTEAVDGELLEPGTAYIAPGGFHMEVEQSAGKLKIILHQREPLGGHRPAVDLLFESVSRLTNISKIAIIMTGMGSDGTKGLKMMKQAGEVTSIIEDESSCIVFGMPRAAIQAGLADHIVPLDRIAQTLVKLLN